MLAFAELNFWNCNFEYFRENKFLRKTLLACLSGAQMGSIHSLLQEKNMKKKKKNRGQKSRDTALLSYYHGCINLFNNIVVK